MKKIGQVVGRAMQKKTSRGVKRGKKTSGPLRAFAKSPYQHNPIALSQIEPPLLT